MKNTLLFTYSTNKHSGTFANRKELSYPKNLKMYDPTLVTLLKMRPHYRQSSRENATPSISPFLIGSIFRLILLSKIQLVVYYQCCILIG